MHLYAFMSDSLAMGSQYCGATVLVGDSLLRAFGIRALAESCGVRAGGACWGTRATFVSRVCDMHVFEGL